MAHVAWLRLSYSTFANYGKHKSTPISHWCVTVQHFVYFSGWFFPHWSSLRLIRASLLGQSLLLAPRLDFEPPGILKQDPSGSCSSIHQQFPPRFPHHQLSLIALPKILHSVEQFYSNKTQLLTNLLSLYVWKCEQNWKVELTHIFQLNLQMC